MGFPLQAALSVGLKWLPYGTASTPFGVSGQNPDAGPLNLLVSTPLLSTPKEAVASPASARQRCAVSASIIFSQSGGIVCMCLTSVLWPRVGS